MTVVYQTPSNYKYKHTDSKVAIPEFPIDDEIVLDLLLVANYLNLY